MVDRRLVSDKIARSDLMDPGEGLAIARLRMMIARSEGRKHRRDFAEAIRRVEAGATRP